MAQIKGRSDAAILNIVSPIAGALSQSARTNATLSALANAAKPKPASAASAAQGASTTSKSAPAAASTPKTSTTTTTKTTGDLDAYMQYLQQQASAGERARQLAYEQGVSQYENLRSQLAVNKDDAARGAYVRQQSNLKNLPLHLAQNGINGGLAESSLVKVNTGYGNEMSAINSEFNTANGEIDAGIAALASQRSVQEHEAQSDYFKALADAALKISNSTSVRTSSGSSGSGSGSGTSSSLSLGAGLPTSKSTSNIPTSLAGTPLSTVTTATQKIKNTKGPLAARQAELYALGLSAGETFAVLSMEGYYK